MAMNFQKCARRYYRANKPPRRPFFPGCRAILEIMNPATKKQIAELQEDTADDVYRKYEYLRNGHRKWKSTTLGERKDALVKFTEFLTLRKTSLARILTSEMGKPISQARSEIAATVDRINYFVNNCDKVLEESGTVLETSRLKEKVVYEPLGVIANLSAWNYPYFISSNVFAPALLTGNSVLYKPSEHATLTGQEITDMLHEAGIPEDAFVMSSGGSATGQRISGLIGLNGLFFTGSYSTGLEVAKKAAPKLGKLQLELGGKDPAYVRHDVPNVTAAASLLADGAFYNAGQSCCAVERIYVDKRVYVPFVESMKKTIKTFKVGDPLEEDTFIGPLATKTQVDRLAEQLTDALKKGARVETGGDTARSSAHKVGYFVPPMILLDVDHTMTVMRNETFGPLIGIQAVDGDEEAIELMKDTDYGLTASVFSKNVEDAEAILAEMEVGTGYWNCCDRVSPRIPWSGRKHSGVGCTLGMDGMRAFVQPKGMFLHQPVGAT